METIIGYIFLGLVVNAIISLIVMAISEKASNNRTIKWLVWLSSFLFTPFVGFIVALINSMTYFDRETTETKNEDDSATTTEVLCGVALLVIVVVIIAVVISFN